MEEVSEIMVMKKILLNAQILQLKTSFRNKIKVFNIPKIYAFVSNLKKIFVTNKFCNAFLNFGKSKYLKINKEIPCF